MFFAGGSKYCYAELVLHECVLCAALALETLLICTNACSDEGSALFAQVNAPKLIHTSRLKPDFFGSPRLVSGHRYFLVVHSSMPDRQVQKYVRSVGQNTANLIQKVLNWLPAGRGCQHE